MRIALLCTLLGAAISSFAQNLQADKPFFDAQAKEYQRWLDQSGLGQVLTVHSVEIVEPDTLSLYLGFREKDYARIVASWRQLKSDILQRQGIPLESLLFYKATHFMETDQRKTVVQLFDTYDSAKKECFFEGIYHDGRQVRYDSSICRSIIRDMTITPANLDGLKKGSTESFQKQFSKEAVFQKILQFTQKKFSAGLYPRDSKCWPRYPQVTVLEDETVLRLEVSDLCCEVLTDESESYWCQGKKWFGIACNDIKRERLTFTFAYKPTFEGFSLRCEIDGQFASGAVESPKRGAYHSMENDFKPYVEIFGDKFKTELRNYLRK